MNRTTETVISFFLNLTLWPLVLKLTHDSMTKGDSGVARLKRATFSEFKKEFEKVSWRIDTSYPRSLFTNDDAYLHASIFRFGDIGYLMTTLGYLRVCALQRR